ncbi:hypothetical protein OE88DRAFT_1688491 [Heliocybe sulcata]|uniref:Uncharacterized protein n=1 Tax=Heliocybe sulcata TaxID=5364 RepID=A0A5C3MMK1_9AGAM|nr:hypothetical protein OE88DRAFT_1688491 [Heliocybe sulcata]
MPALPDEIVNEILKPVLRVPDEVFCDTSPRSFNFKGEISTSAILLVCKQWLRVSTPLLFEVVILRSNGQAKVLARVLKTNKQFGQFIRMLRVEGGYGMAVNTIITAAPRIKDIFITLALRSPDNTQGLCKALPTINPCRLILHESLDLRKPLVNAPITQLTDSLCECIKSKWTNLRVCYVPYAQGSYYTLPRARASLLANALRQSESLEEIVFSGLSSYTHYVASHTTTLEAFAANPHLQRILLMASSADADARGMTQHLPRMPNLARLIQFQAPLTGGAQDKEIDDSGWTAKSYAHLKSVSEDVQSQIWSRILWFAMEAETTQAFINDSLTDRGGNLRRLNRKRLNFLLISKQIQRAALPVLYRYAPIRSVAKLRSFWGELCLHPQLAAEVRFLDFENYISAEAWPDEYEDPTDGDEEPEKDVVEDLLSLTNNLQRLCISAGGYMSFCRLRLTWTAFEMLRYAAGGSLLVLHGAEVKAPDDIQEFSFFNGFTAIRSLEWRSKTSFLYDDDVGQATCLSSLEEIILADYHETMIDALSKLDLPSLTTVSFRARSFGTRPSVMPIFTSHGYKILRVKLVSGHAVLPDLLSLCENLEELMIETLIGSSYPQKEEILDHIHAGESNSLKKIIIKSDCDDTWLHEERYKSMTENGDAKYISKTWAPVFNNLALDSLPALREIQLLWNIWPINQRAYSKSPWIKWASDLKTAWNVDLTDVAGKPWTGRLK